MNNYIEIIPNVFVHKKTFDTMSEQDILRQLFPLPFFVNLWDKYPHKFGV